MSKKLNVSEYIEAMPSEELAKVDRKALKRMGFSKRLIKACEKAFDPARHPPRPPFYPEELFRTTDDLLKAMLDK